MRRLCNERGCSLSPAPRGRGYCRAHAAKRERTRTKRGRSIYNTKRWKMLRRRKLHITPLCERCYVVATDVHHKHGVQGDPWSIDGLESLCHSCHSKETRQRQLYTEDDVRERLGYPRLRSSA